MTANEGQRRHWGDPATVANWMKRERFTERVSKHVLQAAQLQAGEKVVEIGSGGGKLAILAAKEVSPRGRIIGADISDGMVALAQQRTADARVKNAAFLVADCQSEKVPGGPFDVAISQFGVMFFADPAAAFANIRSQLKRGGRLAFACWQPVERNAWWQGRILAQFQEGAPPPAVDGRPSPGPFAFAEPGYVRGILQQAGFMGIDRVAKTVTVRAPLDSVADMSMSGMHLVPPSKREAALDAVIKCLEPMAIPDSDLYRFELRIQVFTAHSER